MIIYMTSLNSQLSKLKKNNNSSLTTTFNSLEFTNSSFKTIILLERLIKFGF